jgi:pre-rRNA-processing protein TSR3
MKQDDPLKCTSAKLVKFRLARRLNNPNHFPPHVIVLNPKSESILTSDDRKVAVRYGLLAIDCSWSRAEEVFSRRKFKGQHRKLPSLLAANPINYGKISKLSSAEAIAAALYLFGDMALAEKVLSLFKWGKTFLDLNHEPLEEYKKAKSPSEILEIQKLFFPKGGP